MRLLLLLSVLLAIALPCRAQAALDQLQQLEQRVSALEAKPERFLLSQFNPAIGMALDMVYRQNDFNGRFQFRAAELNLDAPIDPYLKGYAVITGSDGDPAVDVEEAAVQTTALPYNMGVRAGRFFASFGREAHFHDHELNFIDRPNSLNNFIGGETRADGAELTYLVPTPFFLSAVFGFFDKMGADNHRTEPTQSRSLDQFTYLARFNTYLDITDDHSVEFGIDSAWTPKRFVTDSAGTASTRRDTWRTLNGIDFTYRYAPTQGGLYRGVIWGTEVLQNNEQRFDAATLLPTDRVQAYSGYSFIELKTGRRLRPGIMIDLTEDLDHARQLTHTYAPYLSFDVSEFQRIRLQYSRVADNAPGTRSHNIVALQWSAVLGSHVHGFKDR